MPFNHIYGSWSFFKKKKKKRKCTVIGTGTSPKFSYIAQKGNSSRKFVLIQMNDLEILFSDVKLIK